jgi:hypothetical protein
MRQVLIKYNNDLFDFCNKVIHYLKENCHLNIVVPTISKFDLKSALIVFDSNSLSFLQPLVDTTICLNNTLFTDISTTKSILSGIQIAITKLLQGKTIGIDIKNVKTSKVKEQVKGIYLNLLSFFATSTEEDLKTFVESIVALIDPSLYLAFFEEEDEFIDMTGTFPLVTNVIYNYEEVNLANGSFRFISKYKKTHVQENEVLVLLFLNMDIFLQDQGFCSDDLFHVLNKVKNKEKTTNELKELRKFADSLVSLNNHDNIIIYPFSPLLDTSLATFLKRE